TAGAAVGAAAAGLVGAAAAGALVAAGAEADGPQAASNEVAARPSPARRKNWRRETACEVRAECCVIRSSSCHYPLTGARALCVLGRGRPRAARPALGPGGRA